jgi:hypothetical protein
MPERTYCVQRHKPPQKDTDLLVERDDVQALRQVGGVGVNDILEIL